ncbi:MAG: DNA (cytosine-5-)-methyltransferase [Isosphaeraceae bacterium]|nr:DNA (cytosine-5-)-methyltransferase [Isosphaeraceae bacterium]
MARSDRPRASGPRAEATPVAEGRSLRVAGLFAGIGGLELGLHRAGHRCELLCEVDRAASAVLAARFPGVDRVDDVRSIDELPHVDLVVAGFPCQDLSQAGRTAGIDGAKSGLVGELFRLIERGGPDRLLLENVPFMLQLQRGRAMEVLVERLERAGFAWAYRVVDAQSFGLPQRRRRVLLAASRCTGEDPRDILLADDAEHPPAIDDVDSACGFFWTEGSRGLGWAVDAVPTLKGGSTIGIPSPPAIWLRGSDGAIVRPEIRDAERLQGFEADWTAPATDAGERASMRWRLVGNAVSVPMAAWIGSRFRLPARYDSARDRDLPPGAPWPAAAWGRDRRRAAAEISHFPISVEYQHLSEFLRFPAPALSHRASAGFFKRLEASTLRVDPAFREAMRRHVEQSRPNAGIGS